CATASTVMHLFSAGDHIICGDDVYGGTYRLFDKVFTRCGLSYSFVDLTDLAAVEQAFTAKTRAIWVETPSNPMLKVVDLEAVCSLAHGRRAKVICDNTFATPMLQKPLLLGCDLVVHSTTKYLNGHSDVIGGMACTNDAAWAEQLRFLQNAMGAVPGPWDAWLVLRGTKTLPLRMRTHDHNGRAVAAFLAGHSQVEKVYYPGLPEHPQHALACRQMRGFGGMISFVVGGGEPAARRLLKKLRVFSLAESLGGIESLVEHPAIMTHASLPQASRDRLGIVGGLLRLSVGVEAEADLLDDLSQALQAARSA
ncbi:MAG: aminotransferase class I/II-fold pyridoxal phosphate-dependent enzyme, partial [Deltaproteobacteria bacterium]